MNSGAIEVNGQVIEAGTRVTVELNLPGLYTHTPITMPVHVVRGRRDGPRLFVSAAIHGDELNGIEIIRRLLERQVLRRLRGTLFAVPVVNVYGVIHHSRYLPARPACLLQPTAREHRGLHRCRWPHRDPVREYRRPPDE